MLAAASLPSSMARPVSSSASMPWPSSSTSAQHHRQRRPDRELRQRRHGRQKRGRRHRGPDAEGGTLTLDGAVTGSGEALIYSSWISLRASAGTSPSKRPPASWNLASRSPLPGRSTASPPPGGRPLASATSPSAARPRPATAARPAAGVLTVTDGTHIDHIKLVGDLAYQLTASSEWPRRHDHRRSAQGRAGETPPHAFHRGHGGNGGAGWSGDPFRGVSLRPDSQCWLAHTRWSPSSPASPARALRRGGFLRPWRRWWGTAPPGG